MRGPIIKSRRLRNNIAGWLFCVPGLALFAFVGVYCVVFSILIAFYNWGGVDFATARFVGFSNFTRLLFGGLASQQFYQALFNNIRIGVFSVLFVVPISMGLAFLMQNRGRATGFFRTVYFFPMVCSGVAVFYVWKNLFAANGGLNSLLKTLGLSFLVSKNGLLGDPKIALIGIIIVSIWGSIPGNLILYYAGLANADKSLYEAAEIDGASKFQMLIHITWHILKPITVIVVILTLNGSFQSFTNVYTMTNGGPSGATQVLGTFIYLNSFGSGTGINVTGGANFGLPSAAGWLGFLITVVLSIFSIRAFSTDN